MSGRLFGYVVIEYIIELVMNLFLQNAGSMGTEELKLTKYTHYLWNRKELLKDFQCKNIGCGLFIDDKDIEQHIYQFEISDYAFDGC